MQPTPQKFQTVAALQRDAGACNVFFGWWLGTIAWMTAGTLCTWVLTWGLCPFGLLCGALPWHIVPLGVAEVTFGIWMLATPQAVKGAASWLPILQVPALLLGDFISPTIGIASFILCRDLEIVGYMEGM